MITSSNDKNYANDIDNEGNWNCQKNEKVQKDYVSQKDL